jgi:hypothetical protein
MSGGSSHGSRSIYTPALTRGKIATRSSLR